jgi:hypothetical protein
VFQVFQTYVSSIFIWMLHMLFWLYTHVSSVCFKCFIFFKLMLQMFHLDVTHMFQAHVQVFHLFRRMLQMFHLDVLKVDLVLHMFCNGANGWRTVAFHRALAPTSHLPRAVLHTLSSPLPPLHSLPFSPSHRGSSSSAGKTYPMSMWTPMEVVAPGGLTAARYPHGGPVAC